MDLKSKNAADNPAEENEQPTQRLTVPDRQLRPIDEEQVVEGDQLSNAIPDSETTEIMNVAHLRKVVKDIPAYTDVEADQQFIVPLPVAARKMHFINYKYKEPKSPQQKSSTFVAQRQWAIPAGRRRHNRSKKVALPLASAIILLLGGGIGFYYIGISMTHANGNKPAIVAQVSTPTIASVQTLPVKNGAITSAPWSQDDSIETAYIDATGHIQQLKSIDGLNWHQLDITQTTGAAVANGNVLASYSWDKGSSQQIAYIDVLGHIHLLWIGEDGHWQVVDITQRANAPLANGKSLVGYQWLVDDSQHVVYIDQQKHIQEIVSTDGVEWQAIDLTKLTNTATPASDAISAFTWSKDQSRHVAYVAANKHVMELNYVSGGSWQGHDLTRLYGAPLSNGNTIVGSEWRTTGTLLIDYIDENKHIQELLSTTSNVWNLRDLTTLASRPLASGNSLAAYDWPQGNLRIVVYVDENKHIQELSLPPYDRWQGTDITQSAGASLASDTGVIGYDWFARGSKTVVFVDSNNQVQSIIGLVGGKWKMVNW
ncbi:hypothetical protein KDA_19490 [Dictyobacter alpinus]|uniref:Uncharacterized protein n=1 Tax=Dictyobacter alpinus TaxID=2014873 RepID=A0A402B554_9CHLR|nr:hypothetical protein [Dictyobacter alpinus]GCE26465.1 hypothetical protein KDA_19490 [Dictyobacter alpinus]